MSIRRSISPGLRVCPNLAEVGIDLVLCEIEAESRTVVEAVAQDSLDEQIAQFEQEAAEFIEMIRPYISVYTA